MKDISITVCIERCATKYILNCTSCYKMQLIKPKLFPLMYLFELHDIFLLLNYNTKKLMIQFSITIYCNTCTSVPPVVDQVLTINANNKLTLPHRLNNTSQHSYFYQLPSPWNNMPVFDLDMTFDILKSKTKKYLCENFLNHFDVKNNCSLHYQCTCSRCHQFKPPTTNWAHL